MTTEYRVVDLRDAQNTTEKKVTGKSPEKAAKEVLGLELVRSGAPKDLAAKVYWQRVADEPINVVRLYKKVEETRDRNR